MCIVQSNITTSFYVVFFVFRICHLFSSKRRKKVWIQLTNPFFSPRMGDDVGGGGGKTLSIGRDARWSPVPTAWSLQVWPEIQGHHERPLSMCLLDTDRSWTTSPGILFQGLASLSVDKCFLMSSLILPGHKNHFWQICFISAQAASSCQCKLWTGKSFYTIPLIVSSTAVMEPKRENGTHYFITNSVQDLKKTQYSFKLFCNTKHSVL